MLMVGTIDHQWQRHPTAGRVYAADHPAYTLADELC
jgi:hypothetical protein